MSARELVDEMREAEGELDSLRERFDRTADPVVQCELAVDALDLVERELALTDEQRRRLDAVEGALWRERNRIEQYLIAARGREWWRARRDAARRRLLAA